MNCPVAGHRRPLVLFAIAAGALLSTPALAQDNQAVPVPQDPVPVTPPAQQPPAIQIPPPQQLPAPTPPVQITPPPVVPAPATPPTATPAEPAPPPVVEPEEPSPTPSPQQSEPAPATPESDPASTAEDAPSFGDATSQPGFDPGLVDAPADPGDTVTANGPAPTSEGGWSTWLLIGIGALLLAGLAALLLRRRRTGTARPAASSDEPAAAPPVAAGPATQDHTEHAVAAPAGAGASAVPSPAPAGASDPIALAQQEAAPEDAREAEAAEPTVETEEVAADAADVDALAAAAVPSDSRPWLEFALRPVRAGTNVMDAVVEFELTVGNAGAVDAQDVRIAAWLLSASPSQDDDIRRFLDAPPTEAVMPGFDVPAGDGRRLDATISLPKTGLNVVTARDRPFFVPLVIADARYALPDGGEGRTSAAFVVGTVKQGAEKLGPIWLDRGPRMHSEIEARLHGEATRA